MELTREEWLQIKAIIKTARTFVQTYEYHTEWPFNGFKFDELKNAVKTFDETEIG